MFLEGGIWPVDKGFTVVDALIVTLIAIVIVFFVLILLIVISELINRGAKKISSLTAINAREENKILDEDKDAVVAVLVATIEFNKETGKNANVVSVTKMED